MELVRTNLRLQFSEALSPWLEIRNIIRTVGNKPKAEIEGPPFILHLKDQRQRVVVFVRAFEFIQEEISSSEDSINIVIEKLVQINSVSKLPEINQISYETIFIEPYALPFHELLIIMKDRLLKPNFLVDGSTDVGLIFDQTEGELFKHCQTGPMGKEQLLGMYLHYKKEQVPDNFVFLSLQYQQNKNFVFEINSLKKFLQAANQWQANQAGEIFNYLRKGVN